MSYFEGGTNAGRTFDLTNWAKESNITSAGAQLASGTAPDPELREGLSLLTYDAPNLTIKVLHSQRAQFSQGNYTSASLVTTANVPVGNYFHGFSLDTQETIGTALAPIYGIGVRYDSNRAWIGNTPATLALNSPTRIGAVITTVYELEIDDQMLALSNTPNNEIFLTYGTPCRRTNFVSYDPITTLPSTTRKGHSTASTFTDNVTWGPASPPSVTDSMGVFVAKLAALNNQTKPSMWAGAFTTQGALIGPNSATAVSQMESNMEVSLKPLDPYEIASAAYINDLTYQ